MEELNELPAGGTLVCECQVCKVVVKNFVKPGDVLLPRGWDLRDDGPVCPACCATRQFQAL